MALPASAVLRLERTFACPQPGLGVAAAVGQRSRAALGPGVGLIRFFPCHSAEGAAPDPDLPPFCPSKAQSFPRRFPDAPHGGNTGSARPSQDPSEILDAPCTSVEHAAAGSRSLARASALAAVVVLLVQRRVAVAAVGAAALQRFPFPSNVSAERSVRLLRQDCFPPQARSASAQPLAEGRPLAAPSPARPGRQGLRS